MKINELLRPILTEIPVNKRYRPTGGYWLDVDYLVVPIDVRVKPYCINYKGKQKPCFWTRDDIARHIRTNSIKEIV